MKVARLHFSGSPGSFGMTISFFSSLILPTAFCSCLRSWTVALVILELASIWAKMRFDLVVLLG